MVRYILNNPVHAGLVATALDYPFSGSMLYSRKRLAEILASAAPGRAS